MLGGASLNEVALVAFLFGLVAIAPKVPRIGELVGRYLGGARERPAAQADRTGESTPGEGPDD